MKQLLFISAIVLAALAPRAAAAQEMSFGWPLACTLGSDCWIVHYIDHDPAPGQVADYACGKLTYDGHDGTDIGIRDRGQQVDVLAAEDGVVQNMRNDQPDHNGGSANTDPSRAARTECGNAVTLKHANGWRSFYCHMKEGSVTVQPGQQVAKGEKLGEVGQSGLADFPHLHVEFLQGRESIDPFSGDAQAASCGGQGNLWDSYIPYDPVELYAAGISPETPDFEQTVLNPESPQIIDASAPVLLFWFLGIGGQPGDRIQLQLTDPSGKIIAASDVKQQKPQIRIMRYTGVPNKSGRFMRGRYHGIAQLTRVMPNGETITRQIEHDVTVR